MPKVKPHRSVPTIDMTAMVDVAFLLLTFFILTTRFKAEDQPVDTPSSVGATVIPVDSSVVITVTNKGAVFFGIGKSDIRRQVLLNVIERKGLPAVSEEGMHFFELQPSFGVPLGELNNWLKGDGKRMAEYPQGGIPTGEKGTRNELLDWVWATRRADSHLFYAIRGDCKAEYPAVKAIFSTFQEYKINKFSLVTNLEEGPGSEARAEGEAEAKTK